MQYFFPFVSGSKVAQKSNGTHLVFIEKLDLLVIVDICTLILSF